MPLEATRLLRSREWQGVGQAPGEGRAVLLIPGYLAGDASLGLMTKWLRGLGYRTRKAGIRSNVDCSAAVVTLLETRLEEMAHTSGDRVAIIGQSRGGIVARAVAKRRPDLVSGIVTLGSPNAGMLHVHPLVLGTIGVVGTLGTAGVPHLMSFRCLRGECCREFRASLGSSEFPEDVGYVSVYSKRDGIVNWRACLDPAARELVEVTSSHCGMAFHPHVYGVIGRALAEYAGTADMPVWTPWAQAA
ncbi:MAG: triacylglycerol lipase [Solirubrobacteraceae bacterium]|jgi:pimeloyl-ACP methyl ester carboxylesterase|nr:triacylglycerol lipase [Solirubrobacteraceae bacterium]